MGRYLLLVVLFMKKTNKIKFRDEAQQRVFKYILLVLQNLTEQDYKSFEGRAKAVLSLPSIRAEQAANESFETGFKSSASQFLVKGEFWLRTVFPKLEPEKIDKLTKIAIASIKEAKDNPEKAKHPFDYVLICMATEPNQIVYIKDKAKAKEEKAIRKIDLSHF